MTGLNLL